jgi:hypothetical protein
VRAIENRLPSSNRNKRILKILTNKGSRRTQNKTPLIKAISRIGERCRHQPGASKENAKLPLEIKKPPADPLARKQSRISGGGGERDSHHTHSAELKSGRKP